MYKHVFITGLLLFSMAAAPVGADRNDHAGENGFNSAQNQPDYWGDDCKKFESPNVESWSTSRSDVSKVIVKGGTESKVYENEPYVDLEAEINDNSGKPYAISHVIECYGEHTTNEQCSNDTAQQSDESKCELEAGDDIEEPKTPQTPEQPKVLGEVSVGKGAPATLPETGMAGSTAIVVGILIFGLTVSLSQIVRGIDEDEFINTL